MDSSGGTQWLESRHLHLPKRERRLNETGSVRVSKGESWGGSLGQHLPASVAALVQHTGVNSRC